MSLDDAALRDAIARTAWFHSMELRPGIVTPGAKSEALLAAEANAILGPLDLTGRSVLDVGAWNGFFSFAAKRRGAARVLATDSFTWRHPAYRGRETLELARDELGLDVETRELDPTELDTAPIGSFDVTLFLGVFYHLIDPIRAIQALRRITRLVLVIETHQDALWLRRPTMIFYPGAELDNDPTNWWGPNPALMSGLLRSAGFARVFYQDHPMAGPGGPYPLRRRGIYHAFADDAALSAAPAPAAWIDLATPDALQGLLVRG